MGAAVEAAQPRRAIFTGPSLITIALLSLEVENAIPRAIWKALPGLLVQSATIKAFPAFFANTRAIHAKSVIRARGIGAIH